ncbi:MAG TPA: HAMP domain-containing sensor histidine kinase [Alphaproteobacteria bacterium]|nr:HAMP domain-containing sensor histidine kinase [Alphaproteobacteria bacterium]
MLDIRTLFVAHFAVIITAGGIMLLSRRWQPDARSVDIWGGGALCFGLGLILSAFRDTAPAWLCVLIANALVMIFPLMVWNGVRKFNGRPTHWRAALAFDALAVAAMAYYLYVDESLSARIAIGSFVLAVGTMAGAYELVRWTRPAYRYLSWMTATALIGVAAAQFARTVIAIAGAPQTSLFAPTIANQLAFLAGIVMSGLVMFCLMMMANQQLQITLTERSAEMERIARDRDIARQRAEQANRAKSMFLTMMSHELRTPLNAILGFSELGPAIKSNPPLSPQITEYFGLIHQSGDHLLRVINDILDLSKVEAGKMDLECADLDIEDAINSARRLIGHQASSRGQKLEVKIDTPPPALFADERAIRQILFNLLSNAIRFTPAGGIVGIHAGTTTDGGTELTVYDTGIGIPADQIPRLTVPFEQIDNSYARSHGGTGLGLPLVDGLVGLHGGTLTIDSTVGAGTRVTVRFPPHGVSVAGDERRASATTTR